MELCTLVEKAGSEKISGEYRQLKAMAAYGEKRRAMAQEETLRMAMALELGLERKALERILKGLEPEELEGLYGALKAKMKQRFPGVPQLEAQPRDDEAVESDYLV